MGALYLLIFFSNFLCFFSQDFSSAANIIAPSQSISDGQTLVSPYGTFELGFFNPLNSKNRYVGIWYKRIPIQTVVWVANRNSPLNDSSGVLQIGLNGNLVLVNQIGSIIWSSNSSKQAENPVVELLESGNLVLTDKKDGNFSEIYLWESFNYPSDTLLPGMKLGWDLKTGLNRYLSSWKNVNDPSRGDLTYGIELRQYPDAVIRKGSIEYYRSGPWNGLRFSGAPGMKSNTDFNFSFTNNEDEVYFMYQINDNSVISRFVLNETSDNGVLQRLTWVNQSRSWVVHISIPRDLCDNYITCGAFSACNMNDAPICHCLSGFKPRSLQNWNAMDWSQGCEHETPLDCKNGDGFVQFKGLKLPDTKRTWINMSMNLEECRVECLKNCSCMAYANSDISQGGSGCVNWFDDLIDIKQLNDAGQDLYIRMAASEVGKNVPSSTGGKRASSGKRHLWAIVTVPIVLSMIISMYFIYRVWMRKLKWKEKETSQDLLLFDSSIESVATNNEHTDLDTIGKGGKNNVDLPQFSFASIAAATNDFSRTNKLGEGGFGPVYKGKLLNGQEVAVKRLSRRSGQGREEFKNETTLIAKLQHRNLVRLLGFCIEGEESILIYEYMPNNSLDSFLFDPRKRELLDWRRRVHIIEGIAQGLLYLHEYSRVRIIHRDLKASNILLDSDMNPKISDFGMARIFGGNDSQANTKRIVGTYGYMPPEYVIRGHFSIKSDVFSFGVLLLEILSGRKNSDFCISDSFNLLAYAWELWKSDRGMEFVDPMVGDSYNMDFLMRYINVALLCVEESATDRPTMSDVVSMLSSETATLPSPKHHAFSVGCSPMDSRSSMKNPNVYSINDVTISMVEPR